MTPLTPCPDESCTSESDHHWHHLHGGVAIEGDHHDSLCLDVIPQLRCHSRRKPLAQKPLMLSVETVAALIRAAVIATVSAADDDAWERGYSIGYYSGHDDALAEGCGGAPAPYYMTSPTPLIRNDDEHGLVVETIDGHARRLLMVESSLTDDAIREALGRLGWIAPGDARPSDPVRPSVEQMAEAWDRGVRTAMTYAHLDDDRTMCLSPPHSYNPYRGQMPAGG